MKVQMCEADHPTCHCDANRGKWEPSTIVLYLKCRQVHLSPQELMVEGTFNHQVACSCHVKEMLPLQVQVLTLGHHLALRITEV
jgi:hypothetical protein